MKNKEIEEQFTIVCLNFKVSPSHNNADYFKGFFLKGMELGQDDAKKIFNDLGPWASAAQDDVNCCQELKDIFKRVMDLDNKTEQNI